MNIGELAKLSGVSTDTLRFYERQGLLAAPERAENGYRDYGQQHLSMVRFVRGAQALGFSLAEIRAIVPQMAEGRLDRAEIERRLTAKMAEIDAQMRRLKTLKAELKATFASLSCKPTTPVAMASATAEDSGSGAGKEVLRDSFARPPEQIAKGRR